MKFFKSLLCLLMATCILLACVACGDNNKPDNTDSSQTDTETGDKPDGNKKIYDNETTPIRFATGLPDGVFHPMFSTSAYDGEIAGMTQLGMLTYDDKGAPAYGENEAVVTLDMTQVMTDKDGNAVTDGKAAVYTTYNFLLKNGIKFSDGTPLTIKDVLFNMYVYLDPAYNGSSTMYSVDIVGLAAYRTQNPDADADYQEKLDALIETNVEMRVDRFKTYYTALAEHDNETLNSAEMQEYKKEILADREIVNRLFRSELNTDYISAIDSVETAGENYVFQYGGQAWEIFLLNEGLISPQTTGSGSNITYVKDGDKYVLKSYSDLKEAVDEAVKNKDANVSDADAIKAWAIETVYGNYTTNKEIVNVVSYWATATNFRNELKTEEMSKKVNDSLVNGELKVPNISGITYDENVTEFNGKKYDEAHTVLSIKINKVDPKAIWEFSFSVTPMHYYSNEEQCNLWDGVKHFGVKFNDTEFRDTVLRETGKTGLPMGAGAYKATTAPGESVLTKNTFFQNNTVYFERNTYFETVGEGINNAKIKYLRYQVVSSDQMLNSLINDEIDFAEITATETNIDRLNSYSSLKYSFQDNNGYGYVGINPRYVSDPAVRKAIMYAMDTKIIIENYYTNNMGSCIYRPMSSNSWAYPEGIEEPFYNLDKEIMVTELRKMLADEGYSKGPDGYLGKTNPTTGKWETLKYTFTIAGETTDHPAYTMFQEAEKILEKVGMDITIKTDANALSKLSNGSLAVWAAAWSSGIDPDMYQVYHKDSKATSVLNWGYDYILNDSDGIYNREIVLESYDMHYGVNDHAPVVTTKELIEELSNVIDLGRSTLDKKERMAYYKDALDIVMELAVELPTYQRKNLYGYNTDKIDVNSLTPEDEITQYHGVIANIWELDLL